MQYTVHTGPICSELYNELFCLGDIHGAVTVDASYTQTAILHPVAGLLINMYETNHCIRMYLNSVGLHSCVKQAVQQNAKTTPLWCAAHRSE